MTNAMFGVRGEGGVGGDLEYLKFRIFQNNFYTNKILKKKIAKILQITPIPPNYL